MATFSLAAARVRVGCAGAGTGPGGRRAQVGSGVASGLAALVLLFSGGAPPPGLRVEQLAASRAFPLVDWHLERLAERIDADRAGAARRRARAQRR